MTTHLLSSFTIQSGENACLLTRDVETQDRGCYCGLSRYTSSSVKVLLSSLEFSINGSVRFCVFAAHTKDDLDRLLRACDEVGDILQLKFSSGIAAESVAASNTSKSDALSDSGTLCEGDSISSFTPPAKEESMSGTWKKPRWHVEEVIRRGVIDTRA
jgi:hypothetical protein